MSYSLMQKLNFFAVNAFRDTADKDYVHARSAFRIGLHPQSFWSSLHALEKYAKCILILNRIPRPKKDIKHEIIRSLGLLKNKFSIPLSDQSEEFFRILEESGARFRYKEVSWVSDGKDLYRLDRAVWELRRYCNPEIYTYEDNNCVGINNSKFEDIKHISKPNKNNTLLPGGWLEDLLIKRAHPAREQLVWKNLYYTTSNRKKVSALHSISAENAPFFLYPEIIDEVQKYTHIPREISEAYKNSNR